MRPAPTSSRPSRLHLLRRVWWMIACVWGVMPDTVEASCGSYVSHGPVRLVELADPVSLPVASGEMARHDSAGQKRAPFSPCSNGQCRKGRRADDLPLAPKLAPVEDVRAVWIVAVSEASRHGAIGRLAATDDSHLPSRSPNRLERPPRS